MCYACMHTRGARARAATRLALLPRGAPVRAGGVHDRGRDARAVLARSGAGLEGAHEGGHLCTRGLRAGAAEGRVRVCLQEQCAVRGGSSCVRLSAQGRGRCGAAQHAGPPLARCLWNATIGRGMLFMLE